MGLTYIPAIKDAIIMPQWKKKSWWLDDSDFYYPNILCSFGVFRNQYLPPELKKQKGMRIIGDSGGFQQLMSKDIILDPRSEIEWLNENCHIGFTLDYPPLIYEPKIEYYTDSKFDRCLQLSTEAASVAYDNKSKELELFASIHGDSHRMISRWIQSMESVGEYDGLALAPKGGEGWRDLYMLLEAHKRGYKRVHIFAETGRSISYLLVLCAKWFDEITVDSTTWSLGESARGYFAPGSLRTTELNINGYQSPTNNGESLTVLSKNNPFDRAPCDCPICRDIDFTTSFEHPLSGRMLSAHNLVMLIRHYTFINALKKDFLIENMKYFAPSYVPHMEFWLNAIEGRPAKKSGLEAYV